MHPLPHDTYIEAVCEALDKAGLEVKDGRTEDDCHLEAVIDLDPDQSGWPHGLLLIWEWPACLEEAIWRSPRWQFAAMKDDGSNAYPTDLPVHAYAGPAAVAEAARKVVDGSIGAGHFHNFGRPRWGGGIIGDSWEHAEALAAACEAWGRGEDGAAS